MADDSRDEATTIVASLGSQTGRPQATAEQLMPLVYDELRRLARGYMARESRDHTLQPTALVNEAYLKLIDQTRVNWRGRSHFRAVGARVMRRILIDHARRRGGLKIPSSARRIPTSTCRSCLPSTTPSKNWPGSMSARPVSSSSVSSGV
jgi:RNA polymerase sigma factor (TIGR02999 family)